MRAREHLMRRPLASWLVAGLLTATGTLSPAVRADDKPAAADADDADFIEFLGSVDSDSEDADASDVAESDSTKVAAGPANAPAPANRSSSGDKKKDDE